MEKSALIVAFYFPPMGGGGVQRTVKHVKYLARKQWKLAVLSGKSDRFVENDPGMECEVPESVVVYRTWCPSAKVLLDFMAAAGVGMINTLVLKCIFPDLQVGWLVPGLLKALRIVERQRPKVIYTTSSPVTAHFVGLVVKRIHPWIKWVADFRDPWSLNQILYSVLGKMRRRIDQRFESVLLRHSDHVIVSTNGNRQNLLAAFDVESEKVSVITNGYDEEDFLEFQTRRRAHRCMRITYVGEAYSSYNPEPLIKGITPLLARNLNVRVVFSGGSSQWVADYLERNREFGKYRKHYRLVKYLSHTKVLRLICSSDLLFLTLPSDAPDILPGKIFEYMRSGVPILAVVPPHGESAGLIRLTDTGVIEEYDEGKIAKRLSELYCLWKNGALRIRPDFEEIRKFERKLLADKLEAVFMKGKR